MSEWHGMECAPRDGGEVWLAVPKSGFHSELIVMLGRYDGECDVWRAAGDDLSELWPPVRWQPHVVPSPPKIS